MRHVQLVPLNASVEKTNFGMVLLMRFNAEVSFYLGEGLLNHIANGSSTVQFILHKVQSHVVVVLKLSECHLTYIH